MDYRLELVAVPVGDVDRAKESGRSIAFGRGVSESEPGSLQGLQRPGLPLGPLPLLHGPGRQRLGCPAAGRPGLNVVRAALEASTISLNLATIDAVAGPAPRPSSRGRSSR